MWGSQQDDIGYKAEATLACFSSTFTLMPRTMMATQLSQQPIKGRPCVRSGLSSLGFHDPASGNPLQIRCLPPTGHRIDIDVDLLRSRGSSSDSSKFRGCRLSTTGPLGRDAFMPSAFLRIGNPGTCASLTATTVHTSMNTYVHTIHVSRL